MSTASNDKSPVWVWNDYILQKDFDRLQKPTISISSKIFYLKAFYTLYYGTLDDYKRVSELFVRILASATSMYEEGPLVEFSKSGTMELADYKTPKFFDIGYNKMLSIFRPETVTVDEVKQFYKNVVAALNALEVGEGCSSDGSFALKALTDTAAFLIFVMMRTMAKSSLDLIHIFKKPNIHKHYKDMVQHPFGSKLPAPNLKLSSAIDAELRILNVGAQQLCTIVFHLYLVSATTSENSVDHDEQRKTGLEVLMRATFMMHIAGTGMQLITFFEKLKDVYGKTEEGALAMLAYKEFIPGCDRIRALRDTQRELLESERDEPVSLILFPYCRMIHQFYHTDMGCKGNERICYLMACLIDYKVKPAARARGAKSAMCFKSLQQLEKYQLESFAAKIYESLE